MSNQVRRPPLRGIIIQDGRIVGGLDLPGRAESFVAEFNREYAAIGLRVEIHEADGPRGGTALTLQADLAPVGT